MSENDENHSELTEDSSPEDDSESYAQPDFETLGSLAAIGELMKQNQEDDPPPEDPPPGHPSTGI